MLGGRSLALEGRMFQRSSVGGMPPKGDMVQGEARGRRQCLDVLVVDDDEDFRTSLGECLLGLGHRVLSAADGATAIAILEEQAPDVAVCDVKMPGCDGLTVFRRAQLVSPATSFILITGHAAVRDAVSSLRKGACDYLTKPIDQDAFKQQLNRIAERVALRRELATAQREVVSRSAGGAIVGESAATARLFKEIETYAPSDAPLVISGEAGTGKSLVARTIHAQGPRRDRPLSSKAATPPVGTQRPPPGRPTSAQALVGQSCSTR
jgi:DNA-binding NtrC family response regulator